MVCRHTRVVKRRGVEAKVEAEVEDYAGMRPLCERGGEEVEACVCNKWFRGLCGDGGCRLVSGQFTGSDQGRSSGEGKGVAGVCLLRPRLRGPRTAGKNTQSDGGEGSRCPSLDVAEEEHQAVEQALPSSLLLILAWRRGLQGKSDAVSGLYGVAARTCSPRRWIHGQRDTNKHGECWRGRGRWWPLFAIFHSSAL